MCHVCDVSNAHLCRVQTLTQKEVKVQPMQLSAPSTGVLQVCHFLAVFAGAGIVLETECTNSFFACFQCSHLE